MKILVVDDSRAMRMIVTRTIRQADLGDHDFLEAENGQEALESVAAERPDLVLSDWNMPVMNGLEFLQALRHSGDTTTFGFVTSESNETMRSLAAHHGASFLIAKPFGPDTFRDALAGALN